MLLLGNAALSQTIALAVTFFVAIGLIVNALVVYIIGGVLAERRENQERRERGILAPRWGGRQRGNDSG